VKEKDRMSRDITNLVSKKLVTTETAIGALIYLGHDADNKLPYCCLIVVIAVVYKICQTWLDRRTNE